ncbi:MAG: terpene cyclase/mutase family protein [Victivallales bacterium]|nr:terpene cyclase/mutase family protein [Victivallales bacterium]
MRAVTTLILSLILAISLHSHAREIFPSASSATVGPDVEMMYQKGLSFLAKTQAKEGGWSDSYGRNPGVVGLGITAMIASGEDPNHGKYAQNIKKGLDFIFTSTNKTNGFIGNSMYNHGFATLALAEAYGEVEDERIGPALRQAVNLILTSQADNPLSAWRYSPTSRDADTTVSGAVLVALFAAANAGIEVPDNAVSKALKYYETCQSPDGGFGYSSAGGSNAPRTAIGALVFALAGKRDSPVFKRATAYLMSNTHSSRMDSYYFYGIYYASQAFFHSGSRERWDAWNKINIKTLKNLQREDGSWHGSYGSSFSTSAALLSLALNYRFLPIYERSPDQKP